MPGAHAATRKRRFFASAAAAQEAGFRPCPRGRPETAPDLGAWRGTSNTVSRALTLIELGAFDEEPVESLAERLSVGARHLRRPLADRDGARPSPKKLLPRAESRRPWRAYSAQYLWIASTAVRHSERSIAIE